MTILFLIGAIFVVLVLLCLIKIVSKPLGEIVEDYSERFVKCKDERNERDKVASFLIALVLFALSLPVLICIIELLF